MNRTVHSDGAPAAIGPDDSFDDYEDLVRACPPARAGLTPGEHAALFAPLFGEFE